MRFLRRFRCRIIGKPRKWQATTTFFSAAPAAGAPRERWRAAQGLRAGRQARSVRCVRAGASLGRGYLLNWDLDVNASKKPGVYIEQCIHRSGIGTCTLHGLLDTESSYHERQVYARYSRLRGPKLLPLARRRRAVVLPLRRLRHCASCSTDCRLLFDRRQAADLDARRCGGTARRGSRAGLA